MNLARPTDNLDLAGGRLTIDLAALAANWRTLAGQSGRAETAAVVKGDGYGIGLEAAARALAGAGCRTFFVALPDEGIRLRAAVPAADIYVLDGLVKGAAGAYAEAALRPVLGSWPEIEEWARFQGDRRAASAALHIDTGMNRLGVTTPEARMLAGRRDILEALGLKLVMSHLATADTPGHVHNRNQLAAFRALRALFPAIPASLANSAGIRLGPDYHFDLVRPGIALYGGAAVADEPSPMRPVATLHARILQVREARPGETVGYGAAQTLKRHSRLAIAAVGYADGYHRSGGSTDLRPGARGFLRGRSAPVVGRVSMDLVTLDVTEIDAAERGDWIELMGAHVPVDEVAGHAGTIGYELLTGLGRRHARVYLNHPAGDR